MEVRFFCRISKVTILECKSGKCKVRLGLLTKLDIEETESRFVFDITDLFAGECEESEMSDNALDTEDEEGRADDRCVGVCVSSFSRVAALHVSDAGATHLPRSLAIESISARTLDVSIMICHRS